MGNNWKKVKLGDVAEYINGRAFKPSEWDETGLPIIRIQNLNNSEAPYNRSKNLFENKFLVEHNDLLVSWSASLGVYIWEGENAWLNQHIFKVVPNDAIIDKKFLFYSIKNSLKELISKTHGSGMVHITRPRFLAQEIVLPSLSKQKRIVSILDEVNGLIEKRKEAIGLLDEYLKSIFLNMFGDPVSNPMNWNKMKFSELGNLDRGVSKHRPRNAPELLGGSHPLIQTGEVANADLFINSYTHTYSEAGLKQSKKWPAGTLCITIAANIAKTGILAFDSCFPDSIVGFKPNEKMTTTIFIHFWLSFLQKILEDSAPESAQKNINLQILRNLDVIVPPMQNQIDFSNKVRSCYLLKQKMKKQLNVLENNFQVLLTNTFKNQ